VGILSRRLRGEGDVRRILALVSVLSGASDAGAQAPVGALRGEDPLSIFGQAISAAVDRAVDLSVFATLCGVGNAAAGLQLRDAAAKRIATCFKADSKAATWSADVATHFDGLHTTRLDVARKRGKDAVCGPLFEGDGRTLTPFGRQVVIDGGRYAASAASAPVAAEPCP
jgi:hypothetical protein